MTEQVICVDDTDVPYLGVWGGDKPVEGHVYTIRGEMLDPHDPDHKPLFLLQEISHEDHLGQDYGYSQSRFVPIRDSDIEIFREIARHPERELEDA